MPGVVLTSHHSSQLGMLVKLKAEHVLTDISVKSS